MPKEVCLGSVNFAGAVLESEVLLHVEALLGVSDECLPLTGQPDTRRVDGLPILLNEISSLWVLRTSIG